jgi:polyisoprenoid-binding protein YceI
MKISRHAGQHPAAEQSPPAGGRGLRAVVRTKDGWAVQHAVATVTDMSGRQIVRAEADADGTISSAPLAPGVYTVVVTALGYAPTAVTAIATASGTAELGTLVLGRPGGSDLPPPGPWSIDPAHSVVAATAQHLGMTSVHGRFLEFGGRIGIGSPVEMSTVSAEIEATSIDTGNKMRDDHLRSGDFLNIEHHPKITYRGTGLTAAGSDRWTVHGELTLVGVTRAVDLDLTYLGTSPDPWGGVRAAFRAVTELRREDFVMNFNQVLQAGIFVIGATLKVELEIQAVQGESLPQV